MPFRRSINSRRKRRRIGRDFDLQLTSMMDILVIIVVFLLKSYSASTNSFTSVKGIQLPISASQDVPLDSLQVIITPEGMTFENEKIVKFAPLQASAPKPAPNGQLLPGDAGYKLEAGDLDEGGRRIVPLYNALVKAREKSEMLRVKSKARDPEGKPLPFEGVLAIQADKRVQYDTIRRIMYTGAAAGYKVFRFLAMKRES